MAKRAFLIVLDSVGIGQMPDAADWGDLSLWKKFSTIFEWKFSTSVEAFNNIIE